MSYQLNDIVECAEQNNRLLDAIFAHPQFNKSSPRDSAKPLWFVADFIRTTYMNYLLALLPEHALSKSRKVCNTNLFGRLPGAPEVEFLPEKEEEAWLADPANWPEDVVRKTDECCDVFGNLVGRTVMVAMVVVDPVKGPAIVGGEFDWGVDVVRAAEDMARN